MPIQSTIAIYEMMLKEIPPMVPSEVRADAFQALEQMKNNVHLELAEVEDTMLSIGMKLWPYREAFLEFYRVYEGSMGEIFFTRKLSREHKKTYAAFKEAGGSFADLFSGKGPIHLFSPSERVHLCEALVEVQRDVREYTKQAVLSRDRERYQRRIEEFTDIFNDIETRLESLRKMADDEQEHPELAAEMREHIRGFEHGLSLLGPKMDYAAVCYTEEHFTGRKEQQRLRSKYTV